MQLHQQIDLFLRNRDRKRRWSPKTKRWHEQKLSAFTDFMETRLNVRELRALKEGHVDAFRDYLRCERHCTEATVGGYICSLRAFIRWATRYNPEIAGLDKRLFAHPEEESPPATRRVPDALSSSEVERLIGTIRRGHAIINERDYAIIETFVGAGLRAGELANLHFDDVDFAQGIIVVRRAGYCRQSRPKYNHERIVPLFGTLQETLTHYIARIRPHLAGNGTRWLFLTRQGKQFRSEGLYRLVNRWLRRTGIDKDQLGPHLLRRTFASLLLSKGVPESSVAEILGHSDTTGVRVLRESYRSAQARKQALGYIPDPRGDDDFGYLHR